MSTYGLEALKDVKALTFDVFGTVVNWRTSVENRLRADVQKKIASPEFASLPGKLQARAKELTDEDLAAFAQEWRTTYHTFTHSFVPGVTPWKDVDTHYRDALVELLDKWRLAGLYSPAEIKALSLVWHALDPWEDSSEGLHMLGRKFVTATLSNGNTSLLRDLNVHGNLGFREILSAEDYKAYKPNPKTYLGAVGTLGVKPCEIAMVAAHLHDLDGARSQGLRTIYVERWKEEQWSKADPRYAQAKEWVDLWVNIDEGGFVEAARRLGISGA